MEEVRDRCATLLAAPPGGDAGPPMLAAEPGRACILYTATVTAFTREQALEKKHSRHHSSILGYNAAASAMWAASGLPLVDSGALSLLPAMSNSIDRDLIHFNSEYHPFYAIVWQVALHISLRRGAQVCELSGGHPSPDALDTPPEGSSDAALAA